MELKKVLDLLSELEDDGKVVAVDLRGTLLSDPNHEIVLAVRTDSDAARAQFLADVAAVDEPAAEAVDEEPEVKHTSPTGVTKKKAAKKK